jgi:hypothetical protein
MWLIAGILIVVVPLVVMGLVADYRERQYKKVQHPGEPAGN